MRGPLAAGTGYRNPESPPPVIPAQAGIHPSLRPLPLWGRLREGPRRQPREHLKGRISDTLG